MELGLRSGPRLLVLVDDHEQARRRGFRGSPTITVGGRDVAPADQIPLGEAGLRFG